MKITYQYRSPGRAGYYDEIISDEEITPEQAAAVIATNPRHPETGGIINGIMASENSRTVWDVANTAGGPVRDV